MNKSVLFTKRALVSAIAAFQRKKEFSKFNSIFDDVKAGLTTFSIAASDSAARGELVFHEKASCGRCHFTPVDRGEQVFSNFEYFNIGVPPNPFVRAISSDANNMLVGSMFVDIGLGGFTLDPLDDGKFRTPTLRNVEITGPYMHNGVFDSLEAVIDFYDVRDPAQAEVVDNVDNQDIGDLLLTPIEKADLVAFLKTLTDR